RSPNAWPRWCSPPCSEEDHDLEPDRTAPGLPAVRHLRSPLHRRVRAVVLPQHRSGPGRDAHGRVAHHRNVFPVPRVRRGRQTPYRTHRSDRPVAPPARLVGVLSGLRQHHRAGPGSRGGGHQPCVAHTRPGRRRPEPRGRVDPHRPHPLPTVHACFEERTMTTFESTICYHVRYDAPGRTRILTDDDGSPLPACSPDVDQILRGGPGCTRTLVDDYGDYGHPPRDRFRRLAAHAETAAGEQGWRWAGASRSPGWWCP